MPEANLPGLFMTAADERHLLAGQRRGFRELMLQNGALADRDARVILQINALQRSFFVLNLALLGRFTLRSNDKTPDPVLAR